MFSPLKVIVPVWGVNNPKMVFAKVDLPAPLGPITVTNSPGETQKFTPCRISTSLIYPAWTLLTSNK